MFEKVLVANRGEIAIRVMRTLREMGIGSVGVYSEADRETPAVRFADEAHLLGPPTPGRELPEHREDHRGREGGGRRGHPSRLRLPGRERGLRARRSTRPASSSSGRRPRAIEAMGSKTRAREIMQEAGVPIVPGSTEPSPDVEAALKAAKEIGYPVACKAAGGGGGKGFRVAMSEDELQDAFEGAAREGEKFFSDDRVYLERYLEDPRHVEVQVLADSHGNVIHLGERDCSIQRRHQKLIEEAPGPLVDEEMRERIGKIATDAAAAVDYRGAGTIEGMQVGDEYFFLEMNTRVQVEHCVTEMVTGIDIVREQVRVAAGEELSIAQDDVELRGPRDRVPDQRRGRPQELRAGAGPDRELHRARGPRRPGRLRPRGRRRGDAALRPDGREADRLGRRPRVGDPADAPRARRVPDRAAHHPDPVPPGGPRLRGVGRGVDLPRQDRRQEVAQEPGARDRRRPCRPRTRSGGGGRRCCRADLPGRGRRRAALGQGDRRGSAGSGQPRRGRQAPAEARAGGGGAAARPAATSSPRRSRARSSRSPSRRARRWRRAI